jgi:hypothetical protein
MKDSPPKTVSETCSRMLVIVRTFQTHAATVSGIERDRLATRARRAIEQLRKQFKHKIDTMRSQRPHRPYAVIGESERLGLEQQLQLAADGALKRLEEAVSRFDLKLPSPPRE